MHTAGTWRATPFVRAGEPAPEVQATAACEDPLPRSQFLERPQVKVDIVRCRGWEGAATADLAVDVALLEAAPKIQGEEQQYEVLGSGSASVGRARTSPSRFSREMGRRAA